MFVTNPVHCLQPNRLAMFGKAIASLFFLASPLWGSDLGPQARDIPLMDQYVRVRSKGCDMALLGRVDAAVKMEEGSVVIGFTIRRALKGDPRKKHIELRVDKRQVPDGSLGRNWDVLVFVKGTLERPVWIDVLPIPRLRQWSAEAVAEFINTPWAENKIYVESAKALLRERSFRNCATIKAASHGVLATYHNLNEQSPEGVRKSLGDEAYQLLLKRFAECEKNQINLSEYQDVFVD